ncbi:MAG: hypothetical protein GEV13_27125 [Rhodospirillales bacterium]|nr:hypothetical protein [Rhodospirillales bacterium]
MPKMQKIQKRCAFKGLAGVGRLAGNWPKMQKITSQATAVQAPLRQGERRLRAGARGTQLSKPL